MVISTNVMALNASRMMKITGTEKEKSNEKLTSGYKVNRAADDAAGLQISEKMRSLIRGLDRGLTNITEGISLIDTADGALQEDHSILQRINELSIQAYNGTNTSEDRETIQNEINQCLSEIDRIAETTTFNGKQILNDEPVLKTFKVKDGEIIKRQESVKCLIDIPNWLKVSDRLDVANLQDGSLTSKSQDVSDYMLIDDKTTGQPLTYYGPADKWESQFKKLGYANGGEWTPTLKDNAGATIDYSGLLSATDAQDLYSKLYHLSGVTLSFPCSTCFDEVDGIYFTANEENWKVEPDTVDTYKLQNYKDFDLSATEFTYEGKTLTGGYFKAINDLLLSEDKYAKNYDDDTTNDDKTAEAADVRKLAEAIATDLRNKTTDMLSYQMRNHFDRAITADDPYKVVIYDYRDNGKAEVGVNIPSLRELRLPVIKRVTVETKTADSYVDMYLKEPIRIQCSSERDDHINIGLVDASSSALGISRYNINKYTTKTIVSEDYKKRLDEWRNNPKRIQKVETRTVDDYTGGDVIGQKYYPAYHDENGEYHEAHTDPIFSPMVKTGSHDVTYYKTEYEYGQKPKPEDGDITTVSWYDPDPVEMIADAIDKVSSYRSYFGAKHNRLEHAYNNNANKHENVSSAESRIRDTDMASEIMKNSKLAILQQAGQSVLVQANQQPQMVLQLLQ